MYFRDHNPPHFHILTRNRREAQVRLEDLAVMAGEVPPSTLQAALKWAEENVALLADKWQELHP